jgi:predicted aldo/keto reductase-like oxidoreductase
MHQNFFPLGLGTNRLPAATELERNASVELCLEALALGVNYIDVAPTYSRGYAESIVGEAVRRHISGGGTMPQITVKINASANSEKAAIASAERSLSDMRVESAEWFVCWSIKSRDEFERIMASGGVYDGAMKLREQGKIRRISASFHASPEDTIRILESGRFEAVTLSVNILNWYTMKPIIRRAGELNIPVIVMNPLAGGVIPQRADFFSFLRQDDGESVSQAALRFLLAQDEIACVLSGVSSSGELRENFQAAEQAGMPPRAPLLENTLAELKGFCTGCQYCSGCPQGIDVCRLMQAYNMLLFPIPERLYNQTDRDVLENIQICVKLANTYQYLPDTAINPCTQCGRCESKCTAKLPISQRISELYSRFRACGFSRGYQRRRLCELVGDSRRIAFYPGGGYTSYVVSLLRQAFDPVPEILLFDGNQKLHGTFNSGIPIHPPDEVISLSPDMIIVSNYIYASEIYQQIQRYEYDGIKVKLLHLSGDVPWVF